MKTPKQSDARKLINSLRSTRCKTIRCQECVMVDREEAIAAVEKLAQKAVARERREILRWLQQEHYEFGGLEDAIRYLHGRMSKT